MEKITDGANETNLDTYIGWLAVVLAASLPLYRPWVTLATTLILLLWFVGRGLRQRIARLRHHRLSLAVLTFLALNLLSLLWSGDPAGGLEYVAKYRYLLLIPVAAATIRPRYRNLALIVFQIAAAASALLSLAVFAGLFRVGGAYPGNPSPTMAHLDYALVLALAALLILTRILYEPMAPSRRFLWSGLFLLATGGLAINIGRGGHLAFIGGLLVVVVHWARGRSWRVIAGVVAALLAALLLISTLTPGFRTRVVESRHELRATLIDQRYDSNLGGRVAAMMVSWEIFRQHPVLGTGVGGNIPAFRQILDSDRVELKPAIYWYRHLHNQYLQVATELGLAGLAALAWIFWELLRGSYPNRRTHAYAMVLAAVYLFGFLGEPYLHKQVTLVMFSLFAGLFSAEQLDDQRSTSS
jgi:O-antigen ligase